MRILWIAWGPFEPFNRIVKGKPQSNSSWTTALFSNICRVDSLKIAAISPIVRGKYQKEIIDNICFYSFPIKKGDNNSYLKKRSINYFLKAINDFKPDLIHIHGVEINFGLLRQHVDKKIPIVCSIQGLVHPCYIFMKHSVSAINIKRFRSLKNRLGRGGVRWALQRWRRYMDIEQKIIELNQYFIGRTLWDKAQIAAFNPTATYFHGEELLRQPFYVERWSLSDCEPYRIFISSAISSIKGLHILLKAAALLKERYPNIKIVSPLSDFTLDASFLRRSLLAEDYSNFLRSEIFRLNLQNNVELLGKLDAEKMKDEFKKAHLFVLSSYIENSPNALGEAMSIGTPSVVSPVGGVMSVVKDEESALFFPSGDYNMLAFQIERIFKDDELAITLSNNARRVASKRHDIESTTHQYVDIYHKILKLHKA